MLTNAILVKYTQFSLILVQSKLLRQPGLNQSMLLMSQLLHNTQLLVMLAWPV